jgi:rhamnose transport system permease protein
MGLLDITGEIQTGVIGILLILSVLVPNLAGKVRDVLNRRRIRRPQDPTA